MDTSKSFYGLITALIIATLCGSYAYAVEWDRITLAYDSFLNNPSDKNASKMLEALPDALSLEDRGKNEWSSTLAYIFEDERFGKFERLINSGNVNAFNVLFKLKMITDGHSAERIDIVLGATITEHPALFLESLNKNIRFVPRLDSILVNLGPAYVDKPCEQLIELEVRYKAISSVEREDLSSIKSECLDLLDSHKVKIERWIKETK